EAASRPLGAAHWHRVRRTGGKYPDETAMTHRILPAFLLLLHAALPSTLPAQTYGALDNPTGRPIGGGEGYGDWVNYSTSVLTRQQSVMALATVVTTREQLVTALAASHAGSIV